MPRRLIAVCFAAVAGCTFNPGAAQQAMLQANMRAFQKDYVGAIGLYNQALANDPSLAEAVFSRGIAYRARGNFDRALADINQALDMGLRSLRVFAERARTKLEKLAADAAGDKDKLAAAFAKNDPLEIARDLDEATKLDQLNEDGIAILLAGAVKIMKGDEPGARGEFDRFLLHHPKARDDLDEAVQKWKRERPILDLTLIDELGRLPARGFTRSPHRG